MWGERERQLSPFWHALLLVHLKTEDHMMTTGWKRMIPILNKWESRFPSKWSSWFQKLHYQYFVNADCNENALWNSQLLIDAFHLKKNVLMCREVLLSARTFYTLYWSELLFLLPDARYTWSNPTSKESYWISIQQFMNQPQYPSHV